MKILKAEFNNFGSYKHLEFDFSSTGLALVFGPTGSGKSTIADMVPWVLFGVTAKDGIVDEVKSWFTNEPTTGCVIVEISGLSIMVLRTRGKSQQNDLVWYENTSDPHRGKNINDTQKLLEKRLGVTKEQYLIGAYFHEFSDSGNFFVAKTKDRRAVFERVADLSFAAALGARAYEERKTAKTDLAEKDAAYQRATGRREELLSSLRTARGSFQNWEDIKAAKIEVMTGKSHTFELDREARLSDLISRSTKWEQQRSAEREALVEAGRKLDFRIKPAEYFDDVITELSASQTCDKCGGPRQDTADKIAKLRQAKYDNLKLSAQLDVVLQQIETLDQGSNPHLVTIAAVKAETNTYYAQIKAESERENPFKVQIEAYEAKEVAAAEALHDLVAQQDAAAIKVAQLTALADLSLDLRGELLKRTIAQIEESTNDYLTRHFDAEIRVNFKMDGENLDISLFKSGYDCSYTQLSKGQRQLLKLCFSVSVMNAAANSAGAHFDNLFFDEALDGLDSELKLKAFSMFEELSKEHENILLIDHDPGFQNLFANKYKVSLDGDESVVEKVDEAHDRVA